MDKLGKEMKKPSDGTMLEGTPSDYEAIIYIDWDTNEIIIAGAAMDFILEDFSKEEIINAIKEVQYYKTDDDRE